jgi:hypothetical protein
VSDERVDALLLMDGHGDHIKPNALHAMNAAHISSILRPPHCSHLIQGEDLVNFKILMPLFREKKNAVLAWNAMYFGETKLNDFDFETCIKEPYNAACCISKNQSAWAHAGYYPFTMRPYWELRKTEEAKHVAEAGAGLQAPLIPTWMRTRKRPTEEDDDDDADAMQPTKKTTRLTAADVWDKGPVNAGEAMKMILEKDAAVEAKAEAKLEALKTREREAGERSAGMAGVAASAEEELAGGASLVSLTVNKLRAMLHVRNELKGVPSNTNKAALVDLLEDAMEGYLSHDEAAPAEDVVAVETDVDMIDVARRWVDGDYNSPDEDSSDEEEVPSSLAP